MIDKLYNIMPQKIKNISVILHRKLRIITYKLLNKRQINYLKDNKKTNYIEYNLTRKYGPLEHICYAPYTSMFFSKIGKVSPCYASYNDKSSSIDKMSIMEIWKQGSFKNIREEHEKFELNKTCVFCEKFILEKSYKMLLMNKYEHYAFSKSKYPQIMEFELSNRCNLACVMCDANLSSTIARTEGVVNENKNMYDEIFVEELKTFIPHLKLAEFTGGDPFLIDIYYEIWEIISNINPKCHLLITTNANTMNDKIKNLLQKHKNIHFNVSIDSLQKENYEKIRKNGNFDKAMSNIKFFINYCRENKTNLNILVCPLIYNWHELPDFVYFANDNNINVFYHTVEKPKELSLLYLESDNLNKIIEKLSSYEFPASSHIQKMNKDNFEALLAMLKNRFEEQKNMKLNDNVRKIEHNYLTTDEAIKFLRCKFESLDEEINIKFEKLLVEILSFENNNYILNTIIDNLDQGIDYLKNKPIEEVITMCKEQILEVKNE